MAGISRTVVALSAQICVFFALICCVICAKLPVAAISEQSQAKPSGIVAEGHGISSGTATLPVLRSSLPMISSNDDLEVVAHTGSDSLGRQKRYIGWGRRPSLRYNKAVSVMDHDSLFNRLHNAFDKRGAGPEAPISSFRELRMKQKVPNIQVLLPHMPMRNTRIPEADAEDGTVAMSDAEGRPAGGRLTQEDLEALAYLLEGDMQ